VKKLKVLSNLLEKDGVPFKHQFGKLVVGGVAGMVATTIAERLYDKKFKLGKYK